MAELQQQLQQEQPPPPSPPLPPPPPPESDKPPSPPPAAAAQEEEELQPTSVPEPPKPPRFDPSRMIGIIRRKALIKDLAAAYHAECLAYCQELLELQRKCEEPYIDVKITEDSRKETARPQKRVKKTR